MRRGKEKCDEIFQSDSPDFSVLTEPLDFFGSFKRFIAIEVWCRWVSASASPSASAPVARRRPLTATGVRHAQISGKEPDHFKRWQGWVMARTRLLIQNVQELMCVRPWPEELVPPEEVRPGQGAATAEAWREPCSGFEAASH